MIFSKACEYGIRASLLVASQEDDGFIPIREIGDDLGISHHFLTKVLQDLTKAGLMKSLRGPNGGVALNRSPKTIFLFEIVVAIDGHDRFEGCILGLPECGEGNPCPLHDYWGGVRDGIRGRFESITLNELAKRVEEEGLRLSSLDEC